MWPVISPWGRVCLASSPPPPILSVSVVRGTVTQSPCSVWLTTELATHSPLPHTPSCHTLPLVLPSSLPASGLLLGPELSSLLPHNHLAAECSLSRLQSQHSKPVQIPERPGDQSNQRGPSKTLLIFSTLLAGNLVLRGAEWRGAGRAAPLCGAAVETGQERALPGIE